MRQAVPALLAALLLARTAPAGAQEDPPQEEAAADRDAEARGLFEAGRAAFDGGRFEEALRYFERSYELSQRHELLFNIGHSAQLLGWYERAIEAFEAYLDLLPEGSMRARVEARLAALRQQLAADRAQEEVDDEPSQPVAPRERPEPDVPSSESVSRAGPLALLIGGGAVVAGGALSLAVATGPASRVNDAPEGTPWSEVADDYDAANLRRNLGIALSAAGIACVVAGMIWWGLGGGETEVAVGVGHLQVRGNF